MAKPSSNRRLFQSDGYTFIRWIEPEEVHQLIMEEEIKTCFDLRTDRAIGFKLRQQEQVSSASSLLPFGRTYDPMMAPPGLHYEIPHAGDCRSVCIKRFDLRRSRETLVHGAVKETLVHRTIRVSSKKIDFAAAARAIASTSSSFQAQA